MSESTFKKLPIKYLQRGQYQPRQEFDLTALEELSQSIRKNGIIEPIIVRQISSVAYEIIAGERRFRAAKQAGLTEVPCLIKNYTDEEAAEITLIENIQRENLNPIEEATAYKQLMDEFEYTHDKIATAVGKSRAKITNCLRLLKLDSRVQQLLIEKKLSEGHGKILAALAYERQYEIAKQCIDEAWSVRKMEEIFSSAQTSSTAAKTDSKNNDLLRLEREISEHLGTDVKLENNQTQKSGWLKIHYHDYEILSGILQKIGVEKN